jgi:DNA-binding transcriptional MerR regulator
LLALLSHALENSMKMRELEQRTGVHREVIRVYLRDGLIPEPARPRRTIAIYGEEHVQAIAAIRRLQRENRLTLSQIRALMDGEAAEARLDAAAFDQLEQLVDHRTGGDGQPVLITTLEREYPQALEDAHILARIGILEIIETSDGEALSISAVHLVRIWGQMRKAGFDQRLTYSPDILGFYTKAAEFVGNWEAQTFFERTNERVTTREAADLIEQALPLMLDFFGLLRQRAFFRHLEKLHAGGSDRPPPDELPATS